MRSPRSREQLADELYILPAGPARGVPPLVGAADVEPMETGRVDSHGGRVVNALTRLVPGLNRRSLAKLTDLRPRLACFGHGPPVSDPGLFADRVARLAA
ncbi:MAG: hypothetical protein JWQ60_1415 [Pseudonocardia sp.]|jgi:hypothetical protein|nr:hypothetical protein [Pseudonocardia sp.]